MGNPRQQELKKSESPVVLDQMLTQLECLKDVDVSKSNFSNQDKIKSPHNNVTSMKNLTKNDQKKVFKIIDSQPQSISRQIINIQSKHMLSNKDNQKLVENNANQSSIVKPNQDCNKELIIANRFKVGSKINSGAFGKVYIVYDTLRNNEKLAAKFEIKRQNQNPILTTDHFVMESVRRKKPKALIPDIFYFGSIGNTVVLVMELMGPSLEDLFQILGRSFSQKSLVQLSMRSLKAIESFHSASYIHRDIKPDNIVMGGCPGVNSHKCYLIDFGLSERDYRSHGQSRPNWSQSRSQSSRANNTAKPHNLTGTLRYMSINIHDGNKPNKWDDLISWLYSMIYLCKTKLPWMGLKCDVNTEKHAIIASKKREVPPNVVCENCPEYFEKLLNIFEGKSMSSEDPDYLNFYILMQSYAKKNSLILNNEYDWSCRNYDCTSIREKKISDEKMQNEKRIKQPLIVKQNHDREEPFVDNPVHKNIPSESHINPDYTNRNFQPEIMTSSAHDLLDYKKKSLNITSNRIHNVMIVKSPSNMAVKDFKKKVSDNPINIQNPLDTFNIGSSLLKKRNFVPQVIPSTNFEFITDNDTNRRKKPIITSPIQPSSKNNQISSKIYPIPNQSNIDVKNTTSQIRNNSIVTRSRSTNINFKKF